MHKLIAALSFAAASVIAQAQTAAPLAVDGAWARAALQGQPTSAGYMTLTASEPLTLVGASSPAAGVVELHEMKLDGDVMRMRAVDQLALPTGKAVELKAQFKPGLVVPLTLRLKDAKGVERTQQVQLPVSAAAPMHKH